MHLRDRNSLKRPIKSRDGQQAPPPTVNARKTRRTSRRVPQAVPEPVQQPVEQPVQSPVSPEAAAARVLAVELFGKSPVADKTIFPVPYQNASLMVNSVGRVAALVRHDRVTKAEVEHLLATFTSQVNLFSATFREFVRYCATNNPELLFSSECADLSSGNCGVAIELMRTIYALTAGGKKAKVGDNGMCKALETFCNKDGGIRILRPEVDALLRPDKGFCQALAHARASHITEEYVPKLNRILTANIYGATEKAVKCLIQIEVMQGISISGWDVDDELYGLASYLATLTNSEQETAVKAICKCIMATYYPQGGDAVSFAAESCGAIVQQIKNLKIFGGTGTGNNNDNNNSSSSNENGDVRDLSADLTAAVTAVLQQIDGSRPPSWNPLVVHHGERIYNLANLERIVEEHETKRKGLVNKWRVVESNRASQRARNAEPPHASSSGPSFVKSTNTIREVVSTDRANTGEVCSLFHHAVQVVSNDIAAHILQEVSNDIGAQSVPSTAEVSTIVRQTLLHGHTWASDRIGQLARDADEPDAAHGGREEGSDEPSSKDSFLRMLRADALREKTLVESVTNMLSKMLGDLPSGAASAVARANSQLQCGLPDDDDNLKINAYGALNQLVEACSTYANSQPQPHSQPHSQTDASSSTRRSRRRSVVCGIVLDKYAPHALTPMFDGESVPLRIGTAFLRNTPFVTALTGEEKVECRRLQNDAKAKKNALGELVKSESFVGAMDHAKETWLAAASALQEAGNHEHLLDFFSRISPERVPESPADKENYVARKMQAVRKWKTYRWVPTAISLYESTFGNFDGLDRLRYDYALGQLKSNLDALESAISARNLFEISQFLKINKIPKRMSGAWSVGPERVSEILERGEALLGSILPDQLEKATASPSLDLLRLYEGGGSLAVDRVLKAVKDQPSIREELARLGCKHLDELDRLCDERFPASKPLRRVATGRVLISKGHVMLETYLYTSCFDALQQHPSRRVVSGPRDTPVLQRTPAERKRLWGLITSAAQSGPHPPPAINPASDHPATSVEEVRGALRAALLYGGLRLIVMDPGAKEHVAVVITAKDVDLVDLLLPDPPSNVEGRRVPAGAHSFIRQDGMLSDIFNYVTLPSSFLDEVRDTASYLRAKSGVIDSLDPEHRAVLRRRHRGDEAADDEAADDEAADDEAAGDQGASAGQRDEGREIKTAIELMAARQMLTESPGFAANEFDRKRNLQRENTMIARQLLGVDALEIAAKNKENGTGPQTVFLFGNVKLHRLPRGRGGAKLPLEKLFRLFGNFGHCFWIDEFRTSLPCWLCHFRLYEGTYKLKACLTPDCPVGVVHRDFSSPLSMTSSSLYSLVEGALEATIFSRENDWPSAAMTPEKLMKGIQSRSAGMID